MAGEATILIVDDARINREVLKIALRPGGYRIIEAENGQEAVDKILSHEVDLVLLDLMMPVMDGFEFLAWHKDQPAYAPIPVIVNSALDDFTSLQRALGMGSYDYFTKPLNEQDLRIVLPLKIKNAINAKRLYYDLKQKNEHYQKEIELAGTYQRFLLPQDPQLPKLNIATLYQPFIGVAGDFFEVTAVDDAVAFFIADASGHGLISAMISSFLKPLFHRYISRTRSPKKTLYALNADLIRLTLEEDFVTAFCALYDPQSKSIVYASAGHPPQFFFRAREGKAKALNNDGFLLGMFDENSPFFTQEERTIDIEAGDRLLISTDGAFEAPNQDSEPFGLKRWQSAFEATASLPPRQAADTLWDKLLAHTKGQLKDDVAVIIVEFEDKGDG